MLSAGSDYPADQRFLSTTSSKQEWLLSPTLSMPDWPIDSQPSDFYTASPISSPGVYTPSNGELWNLFDGNPIHSSDTSSNPTMNPFGGPIQDYSQDIPSPTWNSNWASTMNAEDPGSFLPLSVIYDPSTACDNEAGDETETGMYPYQPLPTSETNQSPRKPAWGPPSKRARRSSGNSRSEGSSSRSKRRDSSSKSDSGNYSKGHQLRSTKQGQRMSYVESEPKNDISSGTRASHNLVEKQYRTRLNGQFSTLLDALPSEVVGEVHGYGVTDSGAEKKVSKAEVLILAKKHIQTLERTKKSLEREKRELMNDVQRLKGAWAGMGGGVIP